MIRSMTAYGRASLTSSLGKWTIEIHSVNKKSLDFNLVMSKDFLRFDLEIRKKLSAEIRRGQVTVKVFFQPEGASVGLSKLLPLKSEMELMAVALGMDQKQITFPFLYEEMKALPKHYESEEVEIASELYSTLDQALESFVAMREVEGKALANAFMNHLDTLKHLLSVVELRVQGQAERYRKKIQDKLEEFKQILDEDRERVIREVFFYAEKSDVTEEIVRLRSHFEQFQTLLSSEDKSVGKAMDFLVQEMGREINTLGAKSDDLDVSSSVLKMKVELDKIREQSQNVE